MTSPENEHWIYLSILGLIFLVVFIFRAVIFHESLSAASCAAFGVVITIIQVVYSYLSERDK